MAEPGADDSGGVGATVVPRLLSVLLVARQPIARAGLRGLVEESQSLEMAGQAASVADAAGTLAGGLTADVILSVWEGGHLEDVVELATLSAARGLPLVLMTAE